MEGILILVLFVWFVAQIGKVVNRGSLKRSLFFVKKY